MTPNDIATSVSATQSTGAINGTISQTNFGNDWGDWN